MKSAFHSSRHAFTSSRVVLPDGIRPAVLVVDDGIITAITAIESSAPAGVPLQDWGDDVLMPGLVDAHTHINEPGRTEWEGFDTATRAAAAGGFTTLIDMPLNCLPETTTVQALQTKRAAATGKTHVDWAPWGGAVGTGDAIGNADDILPLAQAGVPGYKCFLIYPGCDGFTMIDAAHLEQALPRIVESGLPLLVHAELAGPIDAATAQLNASHADWRSYATYLASRPDEAELEAIAMLLDLCRRYRFRLHIVHLATAQALPMLRAAKAEGLPLTVETCPHYLHLSAEQIPDGATQYKCAPPVRSAANREALWEGLRDGVIDLIATDHSPCPPEMKRLDEGRFDRAWGGIASLSTALGVIWTEASQRGFTLRDVSRWMSGAPSALAGLNRTLGRIEVGCHASFFRFAAEEEWTVTEDQLVYRHKVSPYLHETLRGRVKQTVVRGVTVYERGEFPQLSHGREHTAPAQTASSTLESWNRLHADEAAAVILPCCGSHAWARELAARRPLATPQALLQTSDEVWNSLDRTAWNEAFQSHPRIGQQKAVGQATKQSLQWSAGEQSAADLNDDEIKQLLAQGNEAYEHKFGRIFLICATGKTAREMLENLNLRLENSPEPELLTAAEEQRKITQLRLKKWLRGE